MEFIIRVKDKNSDEIWEEKENKNVADPEKYAKEIIDFFNNTLKPGEVERELVEVIVLDKKNNNHEWEKHLAGMSVNFRGRHCDIMFCRKCGVTGKRFGLSSQIKMDSKYTKKMYRDCQWKTNKGE